MRSAISGQILEALPGPAWILDCLSLRVLSSNTAGGGFSGDAEFLAYFGEALDDSLVERLRSPEQQISFHARLKGEGGVWLFSATVLPATDAPQRRLILAQTSSVLEVPTQLTFDELLDTAFEGLVILNSERRIVQISLRFQRMFGYTIEELRGKTPEALVPPGCEGEFEEANRKLDQGGIHRLETRRLRRDGTLLEVEVSSQPIASGRFRGGLVVIYRDMTEMNRNTRYRNLRLESTRILAAAVTVEDAVKELLPVMVEALDWDVARLWLVGEGGLQCLHSYSRPGCSCGDFSSADAECALSAEVAASGRSLRRDNFQPVAFCATRTDCKLREGSQVAIPIVDTQKQVLGVLELLSSLRPQRETGRRELLEGICCHLGQFITRARAELALAENEAKFRTLTETAPTAIFIHSDGAILYANVACEALSGYSREEILRLPVWGLFHPEDMEGMKERAMRRLRGEEFEVRWESRIIRKNGEVRWVDYSAARIMLDNRPAILCAGVDITEQRALEIQLRQTQKMEAIGRLAGGIAHDFNNLLMVIGCCSEIIRAGEGLTEEARQGAEEISHAADRAAALTRQLLSFSKHQVLAPKMLDLNSVLTGTEMILRRSLGDDIVLRFTLEPGLGLILADSSQIEQVVMNLVVNSRDAMPNGGELSITTHSGTVDGAAPKGEKSGSYSVLTVTDSGSGMTQEIQQHIFEPFFTTKHAGKGTGLGLSTVYGIVKQSGGFITVESQPNRGSTFKIFFPVADAALPEAVGAKPAEVAAPISGTILLVEDEAEVRAVLRAGLVRDGHKILEACNGAEALEVSAAYEDTIDLLMTDVVMPGLSGRELADRLVPLRKGIKVLYISGYNEDLVLQKGVVEGQMEFLQKPFTPSALARKVRQMLLRK
jgi:PAS domain S-box-containing protein